MELESLVPELGSTLVPVPNSSCDLERAAVFLDFHRSQDSGSGNGRVAQNRCLPVPPSAFQALPQNLGIPPEPSLLRLTGPPSPGVPTLSSPPFSKDSSCLSMAWPLPPGP